MILNQNTPTSVVNAYAIAESVHGNVKDKAGQPYMDHINFVADRAAELYGIGSDEHIVAILHDTLEDAKFPERVIGDILAEFGFSILRSLLAMTKEKGENYYLYAVRVSKDFVASRVKDIDLTHNMMTERITNIRKMTPYEEQKQGIYRQTKELLRATWHW